MSTTTGLAFNLSHRAEASPTMHLFAPAAPAGSPFCQSTRRQFSATVWLVAMSVLLVGAAIEGSPATAADVWPQFRGPSGDGVAPENSVPLNWDPETNIRWRTELPGEGWSSPVIGGGIVYLSAAIHRGSDADGDYDLALILVDQESGEIRRVSSLIQQDSKSSPAIHKKNSHASPTPVLSGDHVYVHFGHQGTVCTDRQGNLRWVDREHSFNPVHGNGGSPVLVDGRLVFTCDGGDEAYVLALDAATGQEVWRSPRPVDAKQKFSFATPTVIESDSGPLVVAPGSDCVTAIDPAKGDIRWWARYSGYSVVPKPVVSGEHVLIATGYGSTKLLAFRTGGSGDVTDTHLDWEVDRGVPKTPSVLVHEGLVYLVSDEGLALCVDGASGEVVWRGRLGGNYSASPVLVGDRIYISSEQGVTTVMRVGRELEKLASNDLQEATLASPAVAHGALFIRTEKALYRIQE